ncbi:2-succinyl-5-enolpyruvyl-6-hydroxy-3-cyclohexene-1-carboxylic-acid synthase [Mangrovimonas sp. YM274]|uniref:2-succinyl-5-enolpyruvyl-6-hydroxy-3- cyclohexene-1-carboxylic-acid synthase n=1 Tax=Mangrovimonas sp. YM274 TaxID=3070660 RepID=UPI0027DD8473|nr:2-succinyl-5-enolpyruvyl-6-hydroxy-3-cyclohexene-1-carboxylic-acid synthase [Mangrovimonas sp. YM274]WMI67526.1 2-succinyl-5-enolpyruvyl-6-hydroxy-3-cyclohexene-1-carboxylic-acid synthase [Mangrovimonas sp. YM274]
MKYSAIPLAQTVVALCKAKNIKHIVISPGSRNAPLTIGFSNDEFFTCYSVVDERCASFFAMGIAQSNQEPVAVVCTSGSALLNYYPAVAEAFYSDIPLVVLSADRPKYLVGIGDGQTINQENVFKNHILYSANLKQDLDVKAKPFDDDEPAIIKSIEHKLERFLGLKQELQEENEHEINKAINIALTKKGPVHINIPFDEPLYGVVDTLSVSAKVIKPEVKSKKIDALDLKLCLEDWSNASKKMILVGVNGPNALEAKWIEELANDNSVLVFTETTSNLHHKEFFPSIDKMIAPLNDEEFQDLQPDILVTFGGLIVSKKIKAFLRKYRPKQHWHVDEKKANDTFFCLEKHIKVTPNQFFESLLPKLTHIKKSNYKQVWKAVKTHRREKHSDYLNEIPFCDFKVFSKLLKSIPDHTNLQIGNSSAIRYAQLFKGNPTVAVYCNRGTSGIDGSTSTAIGFAHANQAQTTFVTGDLSFFYDSNALWNAHIPKSFRIVVINNYGGGIFRILPGDKNTENFDTYFETKHHLTAKHLCAMYGLAYQTADDEEGLSVALEDFYNNSEQPKLLEIFTPSRVNDEVLLNYFKFIR